MKRTLSLALAVVAVAALGGCLGRAVTARTQIAVPLGSQSARDGMWVPIAGEATPALFVRGDLKALEGKNRVVVFQETPSRHGTIAPATFALENAVMWSGRVPVAPAVGILDGRPELSDLERILRTAHANKVDLVLQIDAPESSNEPLLPCRDGELCLTSTMQVEEMGKLACTPVGSLPTTNVISVEARVIRVDDARVVAVARGSIVPPSTTRVLRFADTSVPGGCRFLTYAKPSPLDDYHACCQAVLDKGAGNVQPADVCPDLAQCADIKPAQALERLQKLGKSNATIDVCRPSYDAAEVQAEQGMPRTVGEAIWTLEQSVVHALLGGPSAPASLPPTMTSAGPAAAQPSKAPTPASAPAAATPTTAASTAPAKPQPWWMKPKPGPAAASTATGATPAAPAATTSPEKKQPWWVKPKPAPAPTAAPPGTANP